MRRPGPAVVLLALVFVAVVIYYLARRG